MSRTSEQATDLDMRMLVTRISGEFVDLTDLPLSASENDRRRIGREIYTDEGVGILFRCRDRPDATCLAVFDNQVLGKTDQTAHYRFVWDGAIIRAIYDFTPPGTVLERRTLIIGDDRQAA